MKFEPKTTNFEQKIKKINKDIEKIEIGIGEIEVLQALIEQLMDNHTDLTRISKRADEDPSEGRWVKFEFDRVAGRTETFFNHSQELIRKIEKVLSESLTNLSSLSNWGDISGLRGLDEPINTFDRAFLTQLCNAADEYGFVPFELDKHVKKFDLDEAHIKRTLNKLEHNRLIECDQSLDSNVYSIQIFNFSEDMREPLNQ